MRTVGKAEMCIRLHSSREEACVQSTRAMPTVCLSRPSICTSSCASSRTGSYQEQNSQSRLCVRDRHWPPLDGAAPSFATKGTKARRTPRGRAPCPADSRRSWPCRRADRAAPRRPGRTRRTPLRNSCACSLCSCRTRRPLPRLGSYRPGRRREARPRWHPSHSAPPQPRGPGSSSARGPHRRSRRAASRPRRPPRPPAPQPRPARLSRPRAPRRGGGSRRGQRGASFEWRA
mmetsp:Transcript_39473/g.127755  ORF Transcript_39473/g.127755 Transcript_39473/m.127755 type:complete len:232 (-) Transcript_39473:352-1047(-)